MSYKTLIASVFAGLVLAGCSSTRQGEPPEVPVAENWSHPVQPGVTNAASWWEQFQIPELNRIVQTALTSNANLAILAQRVELARADSQVATAGSRPSVNADTSIRAGKQRNQVTHFATESLLPWTAGAVASWELDWLGKWRHRRSAARESIQASEADLASGRLLLSAEVVTAWLQIQQRHRETELLNQSLDRQNDILEVYRDRQRAGLVDAATLESQEAETTELKRQLARIRMHREVGSRALDRLLGRTASPGNYPQHARPKETATLAIPGILPIEALRRRPDLLAAEARLRAAWSVARAAKLDLYPSLDLRLGGVTMTGSLTDPFRSWMTQVGPRLQIPLWDPNRRATAQSSSARAQLAATEYRAAAIRAIEDIETALVTHHRIGEQLRLAREAMRRSENILARTNDQLQAGLISQLEQLQDQRRVLTAALTVTRLQTQHLITATAIHRALGG